MERKTRIDWLLFLTVVVMVAVGLVMVYSASALMATLRFRQDSYYYLVRQCAAAALSVVVMMLLSRADYRRLRSPQWAFGLLGGVIFSLIVAWFADPQLHRWVRLKGITNIQPSEFAKPALIIFLAWFVTQRDRDINSPRTVASVAISLFVLAGWVGVPDLGTATVLGATSAAIFYLAGLNRRYTTIALAVAALFLTLLVVSKPYRLRRVVDYGNKIVAMVYPNATPFTVSDPGGTVHDTGYQALQSKIAVGAGGVPGLGLMQSKQKLLFLPEAHTDFIYAIIAEELGLWGAGLLLAGYVIILWRGYRLYWTAPDDFGRYLAVGITTSLVFQALLNMSVVLDMGPTKGIPLPLISYGGSSLLSSMISLGLLLSISERSPA